MNESQIVILSGFRLQSPRMWRPAQAGGRLGERVHPREPGPRAITGPEMQPGQHSKLPDPPGLHPLLL